MLDFSLSLFLDFGSESKRFLGVNSIILSILDFLAELLSKYSLFLTESSSVRGKLLLSSESLWNEVHGLPIFPLCCVCLGDSDVEQ